MFNTDESVNKLLEYSKEMVDSATKTYNYCEKLKEMQYLVFAGMVAYYGFDYIKEIYEALKCKVNFITEEDLTFNRYQDIDEESKNYMISGLVPAFTNHEVCIRTSFDNTINIINTIYIYDNPNYPYTFNLESLIHEKNHIINSINKDVITDGEEVKSRIGMSIVNLSDCKQTFIGLEEGINQLQTEGIINEIKKFADFKIYDGVLRKSLETIKYEQYYSQAYSTILDEIKPIYISKNYKNIILPNRLNGNVQIIYNDFKTKLGDDKFLELSTRMDDLIDDCNPYSSNRYKVKQLVKDYVNK